MSAGELVSVVVPAFRNVDFIEGTVASILAQTHRELEVVIADHSSTDGTWEALQQFASDPRVVLLRTEAGGGAERNWNRVTQAATGRWVKLVCGDDLLAPACVERQLAAAQQHPDVVLVACRRDLVDVRDDVLLRGRGLPGLDGVVPGPAAVRACVRAGVNVFGEPACVLLRRDVVERVGGWSAQQPYVIDQDLYLRVLAHGDLFAVPESLASFRISEGQWSVDLARQQARQAIALHALSLERWPEVLRPSDVRLGNARAVKTAVVRRAAYAVWARRMRVTSTAGREPA